MYTLGTGEECSLLRPCVEFTATVAVCGLNLLSEKAVLPRVRYSRTSHRHEVDFPNPVLVWG